MKETKQSLSDLWALLRNKEEQLGLNKLTLTERDILQSIIHFQGNNKRISLQNILVNCSHPRATIFRCLKKLRTENIIKIKKNSEDERKSFIEVLSKFHNWYFVNTIKLYKLALVLQKYHSCWLKYHFDTNCSLNIEFFTVSIWYQIIAYPRDVGRRLN